MDKCTQQEFEKRLDELRNDPQSGLTGPFIHSAPAGNMFRGPFRERAWMIGKKTVLMKVWTPETGWQYYQDSEMDLQ